MIRLRDVAPLLAAGVVLGCSPVVDTGNSPDAAIDAPDTTRPMIGWPSTRTSIRRTD